MPGMHAWDIGILLGNMKTRVFIACLLVCICGYLQAQDRIYFNDAASVDALVREIGDDYVLYKMWNNQDGPDFKASLSRVDRIVFSNGTEQVFSGRRDVLEDLLMSGAVIPGRLYYRHGRYYMGPSVLAPEQIMDYVGYKTYGSRYIKASRLRAAGLYLTWFGAGLLFAGGVMCAEGVSGPDFGDSSTTAIGAVCAVAGVAGLASGIPLLVKGNRQLGAIADDYNSRHGYSQMHEDDTESLILGPCASGGFGLAFNF